MLSSSLAAPNSSFLESYWRLLSGWDGRHGAENICCGWTSNYHASHPTEITAALSMRLFPFCLNDAANRTHSPRSKCPGGARNAADARAWIEHIGRIVERNATHAFHLANWKIRGHAHAAMLHFVLNNTERRARGLTDGHRKCLAVARRWLGAATPLLEQSPGAPYGAARLCERRGLSLDCSGVGDEVWGRRDSARWACSAGNTNC